MPLDINLDEIAIRTNIATDKLHENLGTYDAMIRLFPALEVKGQKVGLYGGTAINKIFFGKRQRLSYDLDILCYSYDDTLKVLSKMGAEKMPFAAPTTETRNARFHYMGIRLDLWEVKGRHIEEPQKREVADILYYFGYLIPKMAVPSYSLEYLLAEKTMAMMNRNELKDIYDTWMGLQILKNRALYNKYLAAISKREELPDYEHYMKAQMHTIEESIDYYKNKRIEVLYQPATSAMIKDIKEILKL